MVLVDDRTSSTKRDTDPRENGAMNNITAAEIQETDIHSDKRPLLGDRHKRRRYRKWYRIAKTFGLIAAYFSLGFYLSLISPTLLDLMDLLNVNYEEVSRAIVAISAGMVIGAVIGGIVGDKYSRHCDLWIFVSLGLLGCCFIVAPWSGNLVVLALLFFVIGVSHSAVAGMINPMCIAMWGKNATAPVQAMHSGFTIGQLMAPLVAAPFVSTVLNETYPKNVGRSSMVDTLNVTSHESQIYIPYAIAGCLNILVAILFVTFYRLDNPTIVQHLDTETPQKSVLNFLIAEKAKGNLGYILSILTLLLLISMGIFGRDQPILLYLVAIAVDSKLFDKHTAILVYTTYNVSGAVSRLCAIFLSRLMRTQTLFFLLTFATVLATAMLYFFGFVSQIYFWIFITITIFTTRPALPAVIGWVNMYIEVTPFVMTFVNVGGSVGALTFTWIAGYLMEYYSARHLIFATFVIACVVAINHVIMQILAYLLGEREDARGNISFEASIGSTN